MYPALHFTSRHRPTASAVSIDGFVIDRHGRFWQVTDPEGQLVCLTVYKQGAKEVVRRLTR
jgi:hypothetical protein